MLKKYFDKEKIEAGCDEAGRGCLAGPVYAAAVILPKDFKNKLLNDSKQLRESDRYALRPIIEKEALAWAIGVVSHAEIDEINILNASFLAMHRAIEKLNVTPEHLLIDGNRFKAFKDIPHRCIIEGDAKYMNIAAASILAKTYRDDFMKEKSMEFPGYGWETNMGYGTKKHRDAIRELGPSALHRLSFQLLPSQMQIEF